MPRSGWLALGVVLGALAATQPWLGQAWLAQPATWLLLAGAWLAVIARWRRQPHEERASTPRLRALLVTAAGALLIGARLAIGPVSAPPGPVTLPVGAGP